MKKFRILMGALALAMVAATMIACNKEKDTKAIQKIAEISDKKPIAIFDNVTKKMTYYVSVDQLQEAIDNQVGQANEYVIESWEILDDSVEEMPLTLKIVIIDTENEHSITTFLMNSFIEKVLKNNEVEYYLSDDFASGNYSYYEHSVDRKLQLITVKGSQVVSVQEVEQNLRVQDQSYTVTCTGTDCARKGCSLFEDSEGYLDCTSCGTTNGHCVRTESLTSIIGPLFPNN